MTYTEFFKHQNFKEIKGALVNNFGFESTNDIIKAGYKYHHCATRKGYQSRYFATAEPYSGKFGEGYIVKRNNPGSTNYGIMLEYYVKEK